MKSLSSLLLVLVFAMSGCSKVSSERFVATKDARPLQETSKAESPAKGFTDSVSQAQLSNNSVSESRGNQQVSLEAAIDRKIIRNADLSLEVNSTLESQQKVTAIAESLGGFVVTSESKQRENADPSQKSVDIKLVVRIPSNQFNSALSQIEKLATNLTQRNVTGQDVTEEFIDLEARIKTQKALELQFLEIMKQANKVADALEVHRQVAEVRTEIEQLEGRKRFLENQSSLSTIAVNMSTPRPIVVSASGFGHTVREAISDSLDLATGIVLFFVRFVIVMAPVVIFIFLPLGLVGLYFYRRAQRIRLAAELEATP